jgi:response regulator RpfG family c-di-GMP phosphodiesterase
MKPKIKILVVDDEPGMQDWLSYELQQQGYMVVTASNGNEGLAKVGQDKFDIAIIDIMMPGMDGITFLGRLKKINPDIEAIMTTGFGTLETAIASIRKGAYDYINKPFNGDEISVVIEKALEKRRLRETVALYEISKAMVSTIEFDQLLKIVIDLTTAVLKSDDASLMLYDHEKKLYIAAASYDLNDTGRKDTRLAIGEWAADQIAEEREPLLLVESFEKTPWFHQIEGLQEIKTGLIVPLVGKNNILGFLNINRLQVNEPFTETDLPRASVFASQIALAVENAYLFKELNLVYMSTIRSFANAIDAKDHYTNRHSERVAELAVTIAGEMALSEQEIQRILQAAQIHDLGKIGIKDYIIKKPEELTNEEREEVKSHPLKAAQILEPIGFLRDIVDIIKQHHERIDGTGYPLGLKGDKIRLEAKIIAVADAYDAMTSDRPYREALTPEQALKELNLYSDTQFERGVVQALVQALERKTGDS